LRKYIPENTDDIWIESQKKIMEEQTNLMNQLKHIEEMIEKREES
jgi:hypothetical protein